MHHYHYSLGAAEGAQKTATGVEYVLTPTAEQDGFESLFAAYRAAYPTSMTLTSFTQELCRVNGISFSIPGIERWVFGKSGQRFSFVPNDSPQFELTKQGRAVPADLKGKGWAHFGAGNMILLPNIQRADGKTPGRKAPSPFPSLTLVTTVPEPTPEPLLPSPTSPPTSPPPPAEEAEEVAEEPWWKSPYVLGGAAVLLVAIALTMDDGKKKKVPSSMSPSPAKA